MKKQTLGKRIKELRALKKMSQASLGEKLFVSNKTISKWENDLSEPSSETLKKMAELFDVTIDYLISGEEKQANTNKKSIYELACKYDDITLLDGLDLSLPDEQGKNITYYALKTHALNVIRYISNFDDNNTNIKFGKGSMVLIGEHRHRPDIIVLSIKRTKVEIDEAIKRRSEEGYTNLRVMNTLGSADECKFDLDRIRFEMLDNMGNITCTFGIISLNDYESALLEITEYREDGQNATTYHYVKSEIYKDFLNKLYEIDFANWKGEHYGMPLFNILFTKKDLFPSCRNLAYVKPSPENYKKFVSALMSLVVESCPLSSYAKRIVYNINPHSKPYHIYGLEVAKARRIIEDFEGTAADCEVEIGNFYV